MGEISEQEGEASGRPETKESMTLFVLSGAGLALVVGAAVLFGRHRPDAEATLQARLPAPQTWTHLSSARAPKEGDPFQAEFRAVFLDPPQAVAAAGKTNTITVRLPVSAGDCAALEKEFGGGCGRTARPPAQPGAFSAQSLGEPLQGVMQIEGSGPFDLSQSGAEGSSQPTEWTLAEQEPATVLEIVCDPGNQLLLAEGGSSETVTCSRLGPEYALATNVGSSSPLHIHLNGVHWMHMHLVGDAAKTTIGEGRLILDGKEEAVHPPEPKRITVRGAAPHTVHLRVDYPRSGALHTSVTTELAATAEGAGHELPTWLDRHSEASYLVIGAIAGIFLTAVFELAAKWVMAKRRRA